MTAATLHRLDTNAKPSFFLVDLRAGVRLAAVDRRYKTASALGAQRPGEIQSYARVLATPLVLAGLLAALGIGVLAHLLITSVGSRRRDLAILKTIGFARRQVSAAIAWQATTLVAIALAIGVPLGYACGRWAWQGFADNLGITSALVVPVITFAGIVVAAALLANVIAAFPARVAARTHAATVLRSE
jgi:ABC-type lipoprotein release transport system permease subunit